MRRDDPRLLAARALSLTRQALYAVRRARWQLKYSRGADESLARSLLMLEILLERVALRLKTITVLGIIGPGMLAVPLGLVREALREGIPPQVYPLVEELETSLSALAEAVSPPETALPASGLPPEARNEVKRILEEARREAERRLEDEGIAQ